MTRLLLALCGSCDPMKCNRPRAPLLLHSELLFQNTVLNGVLQFESVQCAFDHAQYVWQDHHRQMNGSECFGAILQSLIHMAASFSM